jgi:hypothetical protein
MGVVDGAAQAKRGVNAVEIAAAPTPARTERRVTIEVKALADRVALRSDTVLFLLLHSQDSRGHRAIILLI